METFTKGDVVIIEFPFSNLSGSKKRPALVLANLIGDDVVLCQITGEERYDIYSIYLKNTDFSLGNLAGNSAIRPHKLFTAHKSRIEYKVGSIKRYKIKEVEEKIINIFKNN